ncbi:hypothetical protein SAY86_000253 [Trapa natans]|uniref:TIR domain-containing protein n=1 Tax=Trapa natans TaxID=22666 RepID=A0AAN7M9W7_TRANT|nr:hypothetical protein SAY86_000253 [Trapa natans]
MVRAGLRVFRDDDELAVGDKIDAILDAISKSEICVPVFSETFPESKWCLREVKRMVDFNKTIVPIFHKVSVDDVKLKTPRYDEFMKKHQQTSPKEKVDEWKAALRAATENKGRVLLNEGYSDFCKDVISEVLKRLGPRERVHADDLIGVEDQLRQLGKMLDVGSSGIVQYICVHGMGGIGKTALSKVVFSKFSWRFDSWKFFEKVREECSVAGGLKKLKKKLIKDIEKSIQGKRKLLLVLDDVDKCNQIEELAGQHIGYGAGSVIIVTTRDKDILRRCSGVTRDQINPFEMNCLGSKDALRLFCKNAFDRDTPPDDFESLSDEVVAITGRLPLSLIVMGSFLRGQNNEIWEEAIKRSKEILDKDVKEVLKISYDKLDYDQQQIFLDLACLPICRDKPSRMMAMWEACKFHPRYSLSVLESKSLIKILRSDREDSYMLDYGWGNNEIWIHDHLLDLGRDIISRDGKLTLTERSRLWLEDEAYKVLRSQNADRKKVEALSLDNIRLYPEQIGNLENLRLFHSYASIEGDPGNIFPGIRYLRLCIWKEPVARNFSLSNLVTLDLTHSDLSEEWGGWDSIVKGARNLKELILDYTGIKNLPPSIVRLLKLEVLSLDDTNIEEQPSSIVDLEKLEVLSLKNTKIKGLPSSIGGLVELKILCLDDTNIEELPSSIGSLLKLEVLSLKYTKIKVLPSSIVCLVELKILSLERTNIEALPSSIGGLLKLKILSLDGTKIKGLPSSIGGLLELKILSLERTKIEELPDSIHRLRKLELLSLYCCQSLKGLPPSIGKLESLIVLDLRYTPIQVLPTSISALEKLEELLADDSNLGEIPELPPNLHELYVKSEILKKIGDISRLNHLVYLRLVGGHQVATSNLDAIERFSKLKSLELCLDLPEDVVLQINFSGLSHLENLQLSCWNFKDVPLQLPSCLSSLRLCRVRSNTQFCSLPPSLNKLTLSECPSLNLMEGLHLPLSIEVLKFQDCELLEKLPDLSGCQNLQKLRLKRCRSLMEVSIPRELKSLISLYIRECISLERIEGLFALENLKDIKIDHCDVSRDMEEFGTLQARRKGGNLLMGRKKMRVTGK